MKFLLAMNLPYLRGYSGANRFLPGLWQSLSQNHPIVRVVAPLRMDSDPVNREEALKELSDRAESVRSQGDVDIIDIDGIEVHAVGQPSHLRAYLADHLVEFMPDWILVSSEDPSQSLLGAALKYRPNRVIYLAHTPRLYPFGPESMNPVGARTDLIRQAAAVLTDSRYSADYIETWSGIKAHLIPSPCAGPSALSFEELLDRLAAPDSDSRQMQAERQAEKGSGTDGISADLANLSPQQRALLMRRLREKAARRNNRDKWAQAIPVVSRQNDLPLSFAQQRLWFLHQLDPGSPAYNMPIALRLSGPLDRDSLTLSWNEIEGRHEALRTTFVVRDERTVQMVSEPKARMLPVIDLSDIAGNAREAEALRLLTEEARRPFDLARGPLARAALLRLGPVEHTLLFTMHHIISDAWSMSVLVREFAALYEAFTEGRPSPLPQLPIQYADFAQWQKQWLSGAVLEEHLSYWRKQLSGAPTVLELPADHPRPSVQTAHGAHHDFALSAEITELIKAVGQSEGATLFMPLLAVFQVLLARYTGLDDFIVGVPIAGRTRIETEDLIGFFVNTLALRGDLSGDPTFRTLLGRVRESTVGAYAHQGLPFEMLVDSLQLERNMNRNALCQVVFSLQNTQQNRLRLPELTLELLPVDNHTAKFDLSLDMWEAGQGLIGTFTYNTDLFDAQTIRRLSDHFKTLLSRLVADPDKKLSELSLLTEPESNQMLFDWNATQSGYPSEKCVHELFQEQAVRTPDAPAVITDRCSLTYREVNERASKIARYLKRIGVGPDVLVGVSIDRSDELITGLLGILKAGGAYLPLDPEYPLERLAFMLLDADAPVLLTQERWLDRFPGYRGEVLCLDRDWDSIAGESPDNLPSNTSPDNLIYAVYTSGSTGIPKGIGICHRAVCRLVFNTDYIDFTPADKVAQVSNASFDAATFEIWGALLHGAELHIFRKNALLSAKTFTKRLDDRGISVLFLTTALFNNMVRECPGNFNSLRTVLFGGELADPHVVHDAAAFRPPERLLHVYGPTENTTFSTWHRVEKLQQRRAVAPIGRPISNTQAYILDSNLNPCPVGVPGEIYLGGDGLARGYLRRPDLTAEKFVPHPFSRIPGARLYRSGDLARYLPDGNIECLDRIDRQVKIRGFRIELGEIETRLLAHPAVAGAVVVARRDGPESARLVAYVAAAESTHPGINDLRDFLKQTLPDYMVPGIFVMLANLPLNSNGKVDRKALPEPESARPDLRQAYFAPRNHIEEQLAAIWSQMLGLEQVGIHDNFFELGGDSIMSIQMISRAGNRGIHLTPRQIFEHQTVALLAEAAELETAIPHDQGMITGIVPLTPGQYWFSRWNPPNPHRMNTVTLLESAQPLDGSRVAASLTEVLLHHDALRARFSPHPEGWTQVFDSSDCPVPFTEIDLSGLSPEDQVQAIRAAVVEIDSSLNIFDGPLLRVVLFNCGPHLPQRHLIVIHHLICDNFSRNILLDDLLTGYGQLSNGQTVALPAKSTSIKEWTQRLVDYGASNDVQKDTAFWLGLPWHKVAKLPVDFPEVARPGTHAPNASVRVFLTEEETRILAEYLPVLYGSQVGELMLAAYVQTLTRWTGGGAQLIDIVGHGRSTPFDEIDLSRTVGWIASNPFTLLDVEPDGSTEEALRAIKSQIAQIPTRNMDYELLSFIVKDPEIVKQLLALPLPELEYNYLGVTDRPADPDAPFKPSRELADLVIGGDPRNVRPSVSIFCDCQIANGRITIEFRYTDELYKRDTIEGLARDFLETLRGFAQRCRAGSSSQRENSMRELDFSQ